MRCALSLLDRLNLTAVFRKKCRWCEANKAAVPYGAHAGTSEYS